MKDKLFVSILSLLLVCQSALGQDLSVGTRIPFSFQNDITSANLKSTEINAFTTEDIKSESCVLFPKNSKVVLGLEKVKKAGGIWRTVGSGGYISINRARIIDSNNISYPLSFSYRVKGKSYSSVAVPLAIFGILLTPCFGLGLPLVFSSILIKGKDATISGGVVYEGLTTSSISKECE